MSSNNYTSSSSSYSYSSSSTSGQTSGSHQVEHSQTDPSGTTVHSASQNAGEPIYQETRQFDTSGRPVVEGNTTGSGPSDTRGIQGSSDRVQDVTEEDKEAARLYDERIEDEYAKREGGA